MPREPGLRRQPWANKCVDIDTGKGYARHSWIHGKRSICKRCLADFDAPVPLIPTRPAQGGTSDAS